jgi:rod shape-determining protein MreD
MSQSLLLIAQAVGTVVRLAAGAEFPGWTLAIGPLGGALLWPLVSVLLLAPQRGAREWMTRARSSANRRLPCIR